MLAMFHIEREVTLTTLGAAARVAAGRLIRGRSGARGMSTLLSSLMRVDLSLGKLAGANTFVRRPILLQTAVL
jgi:hypothetical protein